MDGIQSLKAGQRVALKPADEKPSAALHGEVVSIQGDLIRVRAAEASRKGLANYSEGTRCLLVWDEQGRGQQAPVSVAGGDDAHVLVQPEDPQQKRQAHRCSSPAVFSYEILPPERVDAAAEEIRGSTSEFVDDTTSVERFWHAADDTWEKIDEEFSRVARQMSELNSKLDHLIALAEGRAPSQTLRQHREIEDFSATGLRFVENKAIPEGSILRMAVELSRFPRQVVHCLGQVVRCDPQVAPGAMAPDSFSIGVHYTVINEDDREQIIRHIFRIQRRQLRNRKDRLADEA